MQQRDAAAENILKGIKIALVVAPVSGGALYDDWDLSEVDSVSPPMGLLWLAGMVRKNGGIATIHDAYARRIDIEAIIDELSGISPDVIGVSATSCSYPAAKRLIERLKERMPRIPVVLGGVHVTALPQAVIDDLPGLDFGVLREGEVTLVELLAAIVRGGDFSKIPGIIFRKGGDIVKTPEREFLRDLDSLPKPAWDLLPSFPGPYSLSPIGTRSAKSASLITSRGCPGQCRFCDVGAMGKIVRVFSADYVLEMVEYLITHCGIRDFLIYDDNFVTVRPRVRKICEAIIDRRWNIQWSCSARVDMVDPELLA
ncbi:MAG: radical SAM protein, partial [Candidatus Omnitrophota bacterium]